MAEKGDIAVFAAGEAQGRYLRELGRAILSAGPGADQIGALTATLDGENLTFSSSLLGTVWQTTTPLRAADVIEGAVRALSRLSSLPSVLPIGPFVLETGTNLWKGGSAEVRLTEKETAIIAHLYKAGGKAVGREELLDAVWAYVQGVETHTLETHIYRLRQKIEPNPSEPAILLTDGEGYRLAL